MMTRNEKIIWTIAAVSALGSLIYNLRTIPAEELPPDENGYYCAPEIRQNADKLAPDPDFKWQIEAYNERIRRAATPEEAQQLQQEAQNKLETYNRRIRQYNDYLKLNCR